MSKEPIEELFKDLSDAPTGGVNEDFTIGTLKESHTDLFIRTVAGHLVSLNYRKQEAGEWEWFEEWSPSTPEHPRECDDCGWRCGKCKTALADVVGGYWDDPLEKPKLKFCPECGKRMKGE